MADQDAACQRLMTVPGVGPIISSAMVAPIGSGDVFGNTTGFAAFEYGISGKWLALLKEIAPGIKRAAVLRDAAIAAGIGQFAAIQAVAPSSAGLAPRRILTTIQ